MAIISKAISNNKYSGSSVVERIENDSMVIPHEGIRAKYHIITKKLINIHILYYEISVY